MKRYQIKEVFHSLQGEGVRAGVPHIFVRFAGCNLDCNEETMGWQCDTDFVGGTAYTLGELIDEVRRFGRCHWVLFTGGEPALQVDTTLVAALHALGYQLAIETNGTRPLPAGLDWVCASPKYERPAIRSADEAKYVLAAGQEPDVTIQAKHMLASPAFKGDEPDPEALAWCVQWVKDHPTWRLSCQQHKWWGVP